LLKQYQLENLANDLTALLKNTIEVKEISLDRQKMAKLKKKIAIGCN